MQLTCCLSKRPNGEGELVIRIRNGAVAELVSLCYSDLKLLSLSLSLSLSLFLSFFYLLVKDALNLLLCP